MMGMDSLKFITSISVHLSLRKRSFSLKMRNSLRSASRFSCRLYVWRLDVMKCSVVDGEIIMHRYIHSLALSHAHTHAHTHTNTHMHTRTHSHKHTHTHTRTRTYTHTHTHTYTHAHTRTRSNEVCADRHYTLINEHLILVPGALTFCKIYN